MSALAPHLKLDGSALVLVELKLFQALAFNVFVTTARELVAQFVRVLLDNVKHMGAEQTQGQLHFSGGTASTTSSSANTTTTPLEDSVAGVEGEALVLLGLLESELVLNLEFRPSEKALACTAMALRTAFCSFRATTPPPGAREVRRGKECLGEAWALLLQWSCNQAGVSKAKVEEVLGALQLVQQQQEEESLRRAQQLQASQASAAEAEAAEAEPLSPLSP